MMASCSWKGRAWTEITSFFEPPWKTMQSVYFIKLHLLEGIFYMCLREFNFSIFLRDVSLEWIELNLCDIFFGITGSSFFDKSLVSIFICFMILIIRINRINLTVLVPRRAALEALVIWVIFAAFFPPPDIYWVIHTKSKAIVIVEMISSQK